MILDMIRKKNIPPFRPKDKKAAPTVCTVPPIGWGCTREPGHPGPCAASPTLDAWGNQAFIEPPPYMLAECPMCEPNATIRTPHSWICTACGAHTENYSYIINEEP